MTDDYAQPHVTYNRIKGGVVQRPDGWHAVLTASHSDTGVERISESTRRWPTEAEAEAAITMIVNEMRSRI